MARCDRCRQENPAEAQVCGGCGARLFLRCPTCSTPNQPGSKFCHECGRALGGAAPRPLPPDNYTPPHLAQRILTSRAALEGERKLITVLFADIKGSMELLAGRDPEEAHALLNPVFLQMLDAVHRFEGTVNQAAGDGIMALFGAPLALEDHAVRACYAALRMQETVKLYGESIPSGDKPRIRVGLNSGEVLVRSIGSDLRMDYTAVGETTHLAARMEQAATPGSVLVAPGTRNLVEGYFKFRPLGPQLVKGLDAPVPVFELVSANPVRSRLQASAASGLTSFVGRDEELDFLRTALDEARVGKGGVLAFVGEPGVGKSRLYREFTHSNRTDGALVLEAASVSFGKATPWLPVIDLLKTYFRLEPNEDPRAVREKVAAKLLSLDHRLAPALPALLWLVDAAPDDPDWDRLDPAQRRRRLLKGVQQLLLRESRVQPLILVFEDLHWIDDETQALLDGLVDELPSARVLLLVNYRPSYSRPAWHRKAWHRELAIDPFREKKADEILDAILGVHPTQALLRPLLLERTEGNPFFLEECVRTLVETGALIGERGSYQLVRQPDALRIPPTVQAILAARIDRLGSEQKRVLQMGAVVGRDIPLSLLQAVAEQPDNELQNVLSQLQATGFLFESRLFPDVEFTFRHALTQEAAYGGLTREQCRGLHAKVVAAIQRVYGARIDEYVERLAHHAVRGETWADAVRFCRQSGARAMARSANRYGAAYLKQSIEALRHLPERDEFLEQAVDIRLELRGALNALDEMAEVRGFLSEATALADKLGDKRRQALVAALMTQSLDMMGEHALAARSAQKALEIATPLGDSAIVVVANYMLSQPLWHMGQLGPATQALKRCVDNLPTDLAYLPFGMVTYPAVVAHAALTSRLAELGEFAEAEHHAALTLERVGQLDHAYTTVYAWLNIGHFHARRGRTESAIPVLERAIELCRAAEVRRQVVPCASVLCFSYATVGMRSEARALIDRTIADVSGGWGATATWLPWLAEAAMLVGQYVDALQIAQRTLSISIERHERGSEALAKRLLGDLEVRSVVPDLAAAGRHYDEALGLAEELGLRPLQAHCHLGNARLHKLAGDDERARASHVQAMTMFREMDMRLWLDPRMHALELTTPGLGPDS